MKTFKLPYHTFIFAVYPIVSLYARNIVFIPIIEIMRPAIVSLGFGLFFLFCFRLISKSWEKAGLLSSLILFLFFTFGHAFNLVQNLSLQLPSQEIELLAWTWLVIFLVTSFWIIRATSSKTATVLLNIFSAALLFFPLVSIISTLEEVPAFMNACETHKICQPGMP